MNEVAVILAAHGSREEPAVNAQVREWAVELVRRGLVAEAFAAFNQGTPRFRDVLDVVRSGSVIVVPVMTSEGYFCTEFLPAELACSRRFSDIDVEFAHPVGTHARMIELLEHRVDELVRQFVIHRAVVNVALVGHGTRRHAKSRAATVEAASALGARLCRPVATAFIDDDPPIESLLATAESGTLVVIPFLIGAGPHAVEDVPGRLGFPPAGDELPRDQRRSGLRIVCDRPIGLHPGVFEIIEARVLSVLRNGKHSASKARNCA